MSKTKQVVLSDKPRLIDLNGDSSNFIAYFDVKSSDKTPFEIAIVDQDTLDSSGYPSMKPVENGHISGNVKDDSDEHKMYYLVLKSAKPCEAVVEITKKDIEPKQQDIVQPQKTEQSNQNNQSNAPIMNTLPKEEGVSWITWLIIGVGIAVCVAGIYVYQLNNPTSVENTQIEINSVPKLPVKEISANISSQINIEPIQTSIPDIKVPVSAPVDDLLKKLDSITFE